MDKIAYDGKALTFQVGKPAALVVSTKIHRVRLVGMLFDHAKTFLLPRATTGIRALRALYDKHPGARVLVSGHTDSTGADAFNLRLSVDRAQAIAAYLRDRVDEWLPWYAAPLAQQRWGTREDQHMLSALPEKQPPFYAGNVDGIAGPATHDAVRAFQQWRNEQVAAGLAVSGELDPATRRQLVVAYMGLDGTTLPTYTQLEVHGCGEFHPVTLAPKPPPIAPGDDPLQRDRRVEVFLFDGAIEPPPRAPCAAPGCPEYPVWAKTATDIVDLSGEDTPPATDPLLVSLALAAEETADLVVENGAGAVVQTLPSGSAVRDGNLVTFTLDATAMPNPTQLRIRRGDAVEAHGRAFDPVKLRDLLAAGDTDGASALFSTAGEGASAGTGTGAGESEGIVAAAVPPAAPAPTPKPVSDLKLQVRYANASHRFVSKMTVHLSEVVAGAGLVLPESGASVAGKREFDVPVRSKAVQKVVLTARIPSQAATATRILDVEQTFEVTRSPGKPPSVTAVGGRVGGRHPRIGVPTIGSGKSAVVTVDLDVRFLRVDPHVESHPTNGTFKRFNSITRACKVYVFEMTDVTAPSAGGGPVTWAVVVPPVVAAAPKRSDLNVFLHFHQEITAHVDAKSGSVVHGMYTNSDEVPYGQLGLYMDANKPPGSYVVQSTPTTLQFAEYPAFDWDRQLKDSNKPVIVVFPLPHAHVFGRMGMLTSAALDLLRGLLTAAWAEDRVAKDSATAPTLNRLAIGGWSSGTDALKLWCLPSTLIAVDEIYAFDGKPGNLPAIADLKTWLAGKKKRKLRMIATSYTEGAAISAKADAALKANPDVTVRPGDFMYWYTDADYDTAHHHERFSKKGAAVASATTTESGIFLVGDASPTATSRDVRRE